MTWLDQGIKHKSKTFKIKGVQHPTLHFIIMKFTKIKILIPGELTKKQSLSVQSFIASTLDEELNNLSSCYEESIAETMGIGDREITVEVERLSPIDFNV